MALTVAERNHWKDRVEKRIDKAIESVYNMKEPALLKRIKEEARQDAIVSLGLDELMGERDSIVGEIARQEKRRTLVTKQIVATFRECDIENVELSYYGEYNMPRDVGDAINAATAPREEELLSRHPLGKRILELRREKEALLDMVWLATSGSQIKTLWSKVCEKLDQPPTPLQSEALQIAPQDTES